MSSIVISSSGELDLEKNDEAKSSNLNTNGFFVELVKRLKSSFFSNMSLNEDKADILNSNNSRKVSFEKQSNRTNSSVITENESDLPRKFSRNSEMRSSIRKSYRKSRNIRNSSLPLSIHNVKFKTSEDSPNDDEQFSSDEYSPTKVSLTSTPKKTSIDLSSKKYSITSSANSRKNSSNSSCYNEASVVDFYRKKRLSNASSTYTNNTSVSDLKYSDSRKFSISQASPFSESGIKLVALEQQPNITHLSKKSSISSNSTSSSRRSVSMGTGKGRRYSIMASNVSDKFWVPPEIALTAQLEKQRCSLPNTNVIFEMSEKVYEFGNNTDNIHMIKENQIDEQKGK